MLIKLYDGLSVKFSVLSPDSYFQTLNPPSECAEVSNGTMCQCLSGHFGHSNHRLRIIRPDASSVFISAFRSVSLYIMLRLYLFKKIDKRCYLKPQAKKHTQDKYRTRFLGTISSRIRRSSCVLGVFFITTRYIPYRSRQTQHADNQNYTSYSTNHRSFHNR